MTSIIFKGRFLPIGFAIAATLVVCASAQTFAPREKKLFTKHFSGSAFDITGKGLFSIEVLTNDREYEIGKNVIGIVVHNSKDKDVVGAAVTVIQKDLETEETIPAKEVIDKSNGLYIVSGLDLKKKNKWELAITVRTAGAEDSAKFIFPDVLKSPYPKGRYSP